jgi:DNA-directed RNA polymerase specialized sigma24 family protein
MNEHQLLEAARTGDENAFARLVQPHRRALHAHGYRLLGSLHDAEDALQETMLRAWRGLASFEGRSSLRSRQHLPARQRAVLILRDVLGISAREVAGTLDMTPPGVDSALQRAHKAVDERLPERTQQAMLRLAGRPGRALDRRGVRRRLGARRRR